MENLKNLMGGTTIGQLNPACELCGQRPANYWHMTAGALAPCVECGNHTRSELRCYMKQKYLNEKMEWERQQRERNGKSGMDDGTRTYQGTEV